MILFCFRLCTQTCFQNGHHKTNLTKKIFHLLLTLKYLINVGPFVGSTKLAAIMFIDIFKQRHFFWRFHDLLKIISRSLYLYSCVASQNNILSIFLVNVIKAILEMNLTCLTYYLPFGTWQDMMHRHFLLTNPIHKGMLKITIQYLAGRTKLSF